MSQSVLLHPDAAALAEAIAARLIAALTELQRGPGVPQLALTGGTIAGRAYARLAVDGPSSAVDWSRVELWWGDERFVAADDPDRNAKQALDAFAGRLSFDPARIHEMPAAGSGRDLDAAAAGYAAELGRTRFDICLLGMGPDGHIASLFPDHPSASATGEVIAVRSSPKPPPERISLTLPVINRSREVWFCVSGADKAVALEQAMLGSGPTELPAAGAAGTEHTLWLIDQAAASRLPADRPAQA